MSDPTTYNYIIIGSGAAGSVVAARLMEARAGSICVIEAGKDNNKWVVNVPAGFVRVLHNPEIMWQFKSEPTEFTAERSVYIPQGKILGGSTSINGLVYNRGQREDFDGWESQGNSGWGYRDVLGYFKKSETFDADTSEYRGDRGPLRIGYPDDKHPICDTFIDSVAGITGVKKHNDYNAGSQMGTGYYQRFIHNGKRENVASRYLKPTLNLSGIKLMTNAMVSRIRFNDDKRAVGVDVIQNGVKREINASSEVLVCAGTVNSAALLQRSGVGDGSYLQSLGIDVTHDLPGVGENFQDHFFARLAFRLQDDAKSLNMQARGWRLAREISRWALGKHSILAWSPSIAYAFLNAETMQGRENHTNERPDFQYVFSHGSYRPGRIYELDSFPAVTCGFTQLRPYSSGHVRITSSDINSKPVVQPNYLQDPQDQALAVLGVKFARQIMSSPQFSAMVKYEMVPGENAKSDDELLDFVRQTGNTGYHLVGTCKMGPKHDPMAVVDANLHVHGLKGIRVIDASVMPSVTSSNTCAAAIMIGEKGADMILFNKH